MVIYIALFDCIINVRKDKNRLVYFCKKRCDENDHCRGRSQFDCKMTSLSIRLSVGEGFDVTVDPTGSIKTVKDAILHEKLYPIWSQRLIFNGKELNNDDMIGDVGLEEQSVIHLIIKANYLSKLHPVELLDPISGQLICNAVSASDGNIYSESALQAWKDSFNGARIISPLTSKNSKLNIKPNDEMRNKVVEYVQCMNFQDDDITNIDELVREFYFLLFFY